jgi:hypothetical protein
VLLGAACGRTSKVDAVPAVALDGSELILCSAGRPGRGRTDLIRLIDLARHERKDRVLFRPHVVNNNAR